MKSCLNKGTLQAYLDRELEEREMQWVAAHMAACAACSAQAEGMQETAAQVEGWLGLLAENPVRQAAPRPSSSHYWAWGGLAVAGTLAGLVLAISLIHRPPDTREPAPPAAAPSAIVVRERASQQEVSFLPLDGGEPIQMGTIVRVKLPASLFDTMADSGEVQAEVIVGDDGHARAIRLLD